MNADPLPSSIKIPSNCKIGSQLSRGSDLWGATIPDEHRMRGRRPEASPQAVGRRDEQLLHRWISEADALDGQLLEAVKNGDLETVRALLDGEEGADPCARVDAEEGHSVFRGSVLHLAIQQGDLEIVRVLLNAGAVADGVLTVAQGDTTLKGTALHLAVERGSLEIVKALLDEGAHPNAPMVKITGDHEFSGTALHAATVLRHPGIVLALLEAGANTETPTNHGKTASDIARDVGAHQIADLIDGKAEE